MYGFMSNLTCSPFFNLQVKQFMKVLNSFNFIYFQIFFFLKDNLIRLQATGHTVLVDAAAAVGQAAFADVLSAAGSVDVAAAVDQQVFPLTDIS